MAIKLKKKKNPPIVCLESQLKKNAVSILIFVLLWHFFFILKIHKESTHNSPAVWVCHWRLGSLFLHHFEGRELDWESVIESAR